MVSVPADISTQVTITLVIKRSTHDNGMTLLEFADAVVAGTQQPLNHDDFAYHFSSELSDLNIVIDWATSNGLTIHEASPTKAVVLVQGTVGQFNSLFNIECQTVTTDTRTYMNYSGTLTIPSSISNVVERVIGLDDSLQIKKHIVPVPEINPNPTPTPSSSGPVTPVQMKIAYNVPAGTGTGMTIGILELAGGWTQSDVNQSFSRIGLTPPTVVNVNVAGGYNSGASDAETMMDIYCAGGVAPNAKIATYFSTLSSAGFYNGFLAAANDTVNNPEVLSVSWNYNTDISDSDPTNGLGTAIAACVAKGILVFISSGDDGGNGWQCCYPASSNYVIACGGTTIYLSPSYTITLEQTWSGSGGAVSRYQSLPTWQTSPTLYYTTITSTGTIWYPQALPRRGVPDFSAPADPYTGYQFYVGGVLNQNGGTSAAAPLLAGCFTILDQVLGRRLGYNELMTALYANPSVFHDITVGQNNQDWHQRSEEHTSELQSH